ncbi:hypothetical protein D6851_17340, partial [Altericroceibacterium spongiae]
NMGDVNGDGYDDWIVGAYQNDEGGTNTGAAYVLFGGAGGFGTVDATGRRVIDLSSLSASQGFAILGDNTEDSLGYSVSLAGDVNGDGYDDVIVGVFGDDDGGTTAGAAYVLFGKASGFGTVDLGGGLSASDGFKITGDTTEDLLGYSVSSAGDVNGDGYDDVIVGAYGNDAGGTYAGAAYVLFGKASGFGTVDLGNTLNASDGFKITSDASNDYLGYSVSSAGDVNGDGYDDVIVGAHGNDDGGSTAGAAYVLFGKASGFGTVDLGSGLSAADGFQIMGAVAGDSLGYSVSSAGDVNGDGYDDLIVGAYYNDDGGSTAGAAYVLFGKASGFGTVDLGSGLSASDGFKIMGAAVDDSLGYSVSSAGDVNGDGYADLIIGARQNDAGGSDAGAAYVIFGKASGFGTVDLDTLTAADGFIIQGDTIGDNLGVSVSSAGDIDGDGYDDLLVGANGGDDGGEDAGEVYVLYGSALYGQQGEQTDRALTGTASADILIGGNGDDTIVSAGGADVIRSGAGDDRITLTDFTFEDIHGGRGFDSLVLDGAGLNFDLTAILPGDLRSVEAIDLTGSGDNVLTISGENLLDISDWRMDGEAYMLVTGDAGDSVVTQGFTYGGTQIYEGVTYNLYERGYANLLVEQDVAVTNEPFGTAPVIDTSILKEHYGFIVQGDEANDYLGYSSMQNMGDVNGDGYDDWIVGAYYNDDGGSDAGAAYVLFGGAGGFGTPDATGRRVIDLSSLSASQGFAILGENSNDYLGLSVSLAGDVNGDGYDDLIVGAYDNDAGGSTAGAAYVLFGKASGFGTVDLGSGLSASDGFKIIGDASGDYLGMSVSSAGDVNGDGYDDVIVGARYNDDGGGNTGTAYVLFGKASGFGTVDTSSSLSASDGFKIYGDNDSDYLGYSVSSAGDVNGDGYDDLIVGAYANNDGGIDDEGAAYVIFGKASGFGTVDLGSGLSASDGFKIMGAVANDYLGYSVSLAGDVNGDGYADLIIGAHYNDDGGSEAGAAYVIFGKASGFGTVDLGSGLSASDGFQIMGDTTEDFLGYSVSSAGDVNGDGYDDVIVGAYGNDAGGSDAGAAYVIFGKASGFGTVDLDILAAADGFIIQGDTIGDNLGVSVSSAGDIDGDGYDDLLVGANGGGDGGGNAGEVYVLFGRPDMGADIMQGTSNADTLVGTSGADIIIGDEGDDIIVTGGGADVVRGGAGDDLIRLVDFDFEDIHGGRGFDTLVLQDLGMNLDLTAILPGDLRSIEAVDLTGDGDNSLSFTAETVFDISDWRMDGEAWMIVKGDAGDSAIGLEGFTYGGTYDYEGVTYNLYERGYANVLVEQDVTFTNDPLGTAPVIDTSILKEHYGFIVQGDEAGDRLGYRSMQNMGDVNGDGYDDWIIGAYVNDDGGSDTGAAYVLFGGAGGFGTVDATGRRVIDLSSLSASQGFAILGDNSSDYLGYSVSLAGDVNGDGYDDLIIGAYRNDDGGTSAGAAYVLFGKASGFGTVDLGNTLSAADGFKIIGDTTEDYLGLSVSSAGDVNGDGYDDLIVGAYRNDDGGTDTGTAYVLFGKASGFGTVDTSSSLSASDGFKIYGDNTDDYLGYSVSSAGDVNGDGYADVIVGAHGNDDGGTDTGTAYVLFGKASGFGTVNTSSSLSASDGFKIYGDNTDDYLGLSVSSAGDVNGDGYDDLIVGAYANDDGGSDDEGAAYVIFGKASGFGTVDLGSGLSASDGFKIMGAVSNDYLGYSVSSAGDVNGDGYADLIIGAYANDDGGSDAGAAYVIFGKASGYGTVDLDTLTAADGFIIQGDTADDYLGIAVSSAGDIDGDGYDDLLVGAYSGDDGGSNAGEAYVLYGSALYGQQGEQTDRALTGTASADILIGGNGDDAIISAGGADVIRSGAGDDRITLTDFTFEDIHGGRGFDSLVLDGAGLNFDLTAILPGDLRSVEAIDLTGSGDNVLTISGENLLDISDWRM